MFIGCRGLIQPQPQPWRVWRAAMRAIIRRLAGETKTFMSLHIPDFRHAQVLVAGDVMLDHYCYGETSRISPEAPVPVVHIQGAEKRRRG